MEQINIPSSDGNRIVATDTIIRIQSLNNYSKLYFTNQKPLVVAKVLLWFECRLPAETFTRIHRSHLVNRQYILSINGNWSSSNVLLSNGEKIDMSRRRRSGFIRSKLIAGISPDMFCNTTCSKKTIVRESNRHK